MSGNLGITQVVASQNQKEVTINGALLRLDAAISQTFEANLTSGNVTVTTDQGQQCTLIRATNVSTSGRTVTVPQVERVFLIANPGTSTHSVGFVRGTTTVTLARGQTAVVRTDGTSNGLVVLLLGLGGMATVTKPANTSRVSTTTYTDDPHLIFPLLASTRYMVRARLMFRAVTAGGRYQVQPAYSGTITEAYGRRTYSDLGVTTPSAAARFEATDNALPAAISITGGSATGVAVVELSFGIQTNAAGTLSIQWAQSVSNANATELLAGSSLEVTAL